MANTAIANDVDQELFSELEEPLVQPLLIHMVAPFVNGDDKNFSLQIKGKIVWEWKTLEGKFKETVCGNASREARIHVLDGKKCLTVKSLFRNVVFTFIVSFYSHIEDTNFSKPYKPYKSYKLYKSCSSSCGTSLIQAT